MRNYKNIKNYILERGAINELGNLLKDRRKEKDSAVVFFVDDFFDGKDLVKKMPIGEKDILNFISTKTEPVSNYIDSLSDNIKNLLGGNLPVAVIGVGGGTVMDISKCVSILLTNDGNAQDYQGWDLVKNPGVFKIGIPTISGTGAESSRTGIFTSPKAKLGMNSDYAMFDQLILDPDLLNTVPKDQFFYTAMDCYIHDIELLHGRKVNIMTRSLVEQSLKLMREIFLGEMDFEKLMLASYFGGLAMATANVAGHVCHPVAYGLGTILGCKHGLAVCLAFSQLGEYYTEEIKEFNSILDKFEIKLPKNITSGVSDVQMEEMVNATLKNEKPLENAFGPNWRDVLTKKKVIEILSKI